MPSDKAATLPDGRAVSYKLSSPRQAVAPVVILSNSLAAPFETWNRVVETLVESGYAVLQYDQPGHGETSSPSNLQATTFESMADDVFHLLTTLNITKVSAWIGVSMGAAKGMYFATRYPGVIQDLVVCDTISGSPSVTGTADVFGPRADQAQKEGSMKSLVDATLNRWFSEKWRQSYPAEMEKMRNIMMGTSVDGFVTCIRALQAPNFDLKPLAPKLSTSVERVLFIVGELDANLPQTMNELRRLTQEGFDVVGKPARVELKVIKDAGHVCYVDGYQQFRDEILRYLQSN